jgi:hypothetical protein
MYEIGDNLIIIYTYFIIITTFVDQKFLTPEISEFVLQLVGTIKKGYKGDKWSIFDMSNTNIL